MTNFSTKKYLDNYKIGIKYEDFFYKLLISRFLKHDDILIIQTDFYDYCDFKIFKVIDNINYLIAQIEIKCRITDTQNFKFLFCNKSKKINYLYDDEVNFSKEQGYFKEFILIYNCIKENCFYYNSFDNFDIKGDKNVFKTDLIKTYEINDIFNYINTLIC